MQTFLIIAGLGILGAGAVMPYAFWVNRKQLAEAPLPFPALVAASIAQTSILVLIATGLGLWASEAIGIEIPYFRGDKDVSDFFNVARFAFLLGGLVGAITLGLEKFVFMAHLPADFMDQARGIPFWRRFLAIFYGSITEEILTRLFALTGFAWLLVKIWGQDTPSNGVLWAATFTAALLFGLLHLPTTAAMTKLTPLIVGRALLLNGLGGIVFGYLYWHEGLAVAMVAHLAMDMMLHLVGYSLLHSETMQGELSQQTVL